MGVHTLQHCVARDVSENVSRNVAPCVWAFKEAMEMRPIMQFHLPKENTFVKISKTPSKTYVRHLKKEGRE